MVRPLFRAPRTLRTQIRPKPIQQHMTTYVEIAVNIPQVTGVFHYHLPPGWDAPVQAGQLVTVPFGRQTVQGILLGSIDDPSTPQTKEVIELIDPVPVLTPAQIRLAQALADESLAPLSACLALMLPPGLSQVADTMYQLTESGAGDRIDRDALSPAQLRLLELLAERGPLRGRQITHALPRRNWQGSMQALKRRGLVSSEPVLQEPSVRPKTMRTAQLACSPIEAETAMDTLARAGSAALERRQKILQFLLQEQGAVEVPWIYAHSGGNASDLRRLADLGLIFLGEAETLRDPLEELEFVPAVAPQLTREQAEVWAQVQAGLQRSRDGQTVLPFLLYGVTGSGKTEIYLHAVAEVLTRGQQAIILVPEIALTPQTVRRFVARFPNQVGLVHSRLSQGERYDTWRRARAGLISLVVGPRSALFTPFSDLGLIVVDECHDDSYYQGESAPSFNARELAALYSKQTRAVCVLGSATPDVSSTYKAAHGSWTPLSLPERILAHKEAVRRQLQRIGSEAQSHFHPLEAEAETTELPPIQLVDMRQELKAGNRSIFSRALQAGLEQVLAHQQQAILFLNRRGSATYVFCRDCGYTLKCPRCDIPLTYHSSYSRQRGGLPQAALICHRCNYQRQLPSQCPQCRSPRIKQYGTGTEKVEEEIHARFPQARTLRWDWETTRQKGSHDAILSMFSDQQADILIGTQMLAKGLDLPLVTLVGAVLADVGLNLPDYRASERTFQVLTQVAGRAGRSPLGGQVILQTFEPEHYVLQAAAQHDYRTFYRQELDYRRRLHYPPFTRLVRLELRGPKEQPIKQAAEQLKADLQAWQNESRGSVTEIIGPVPCFFARVAGDYRWQIILRGPDPVQLLKGRRLDQIRVEVDPPSLL